MFTQLNSKTLVQCYRADELLSYEIYPTQKRTKKNQKDILRKTVSISPPVYDMASVYTGSEDPFENMTNPTKHQHNVMQKRKKKVVFNLCECFDNVTDRKHKSNYNDKTWDSITRLYGNTDTTEVWADPGYETSKFDQEKYKKDRVLKANAIEIWPTDYTNNSKKNKRKPKTPKKRNHHFTSHILPQDVNQKDYPTLDNPIPFDTSTVSLYRKNYMNNQNARHVRDYSNLKRKSKSKKVRPENVDVLTSFKGECPDGKCAEEAKRNKSFLCKCNISREPQPVTKDCTDSTCELSRNSLSINSVVKMKDKFLCICHKYSQKLINLRPYNNDVARREHISTKRKLPKKEIKINEVIKKEHESEQTGEPFFEIQVSPRDMCVLNPIEIKENILKYGRPEKSEPTCICPSRGTLKADEVCKSGVCKKAYKNKQVNFNCWCEKKVAECGDATCDNINVGKIEQKNAKHLWNQKINKPLLEVQLDMDKMCVVNPREIKDKIINNISVDEICSSGVCRDAALERKVPYFCRCIRKKIHSEITECKDDTCTDTTRKKKSKFSLLYNRICSKSESWSHRNRNNDRKRIKRRSFYEINPNKLRRGQVSPQADDLHKGKQEIKKENMPKLKTTQNVNKGKVETKQKNTPKSNVPQNPIKKKVDIKQKNVQKLNRPQKDNIKIRQEKTPKLNKKQVGVNKHNNLNYHDVVIPSARQGELKQHNTTNVKSTGVSKELHYKTTEVICGCAHTCECDKDKKDDLKIELKNTKYKEKQKKKKLAKKRRNKKKDIYNSEKDLEKRAKLDKKREKRAAKLRLKEIKMMQKKLNEEPLDTNFCTAFLLGILKIGIRTIIFIITIIWTVIKKPRKAYWYVMDRITDPEGTYNKMKKWFRDAIMIKKLQIADTIRGSDTLTILADHFLDTTFYQSVADKGRTKRDQMAFEQKSKARKRRIRKREQQAIHSCRHMLLTTLRQTPCLWVYHICPNFYPQCLGLLAFMRSFSRILLFLVAFACWTPCILSFELCRAFLCCFMCTG